MVATIMVTARRDTAEMGRIVTMRIVMMRMVTTRIIEIRTMRMND